MGAPSPLIAYVAQAGACAARDGGSSNDAMPSTPGDVIGSVVAQQMDASVCCNLSPHLNVLTRCDIGDQVVYLLTLGVAEPWRCVHRRSTPGSPWLESPVVVHCVCLCGCCSHKGVATTLVRTVCDLVSANRATKAVFLHVLCTNEAAMALYLSLGFAVVNVLPGAKCVVASATHVNPQGAECAQIV
jgi:hypothetical protein